MTIVNPGYGGEVHLDTDKYNTFIVGAINIQSGTVTRLYGASSQTAITVSAGGTITIDGVTSGGFLRVNATGDLTVRTSSAQAEALVSNFGDHTRTMFDTVYSAAYIEINRAGNGTLTLVERCQTRQLNVLERPFVLDHNPANSVISIYGNYLVGPPYSFGYFNNHYPAHQEALYVNLYGASDEVPSDDQVFLSYNVIAGSVYAQLAGGDDSVNLQVNQIQGGGLFDGGFGVNRLTRTYETSPNLVAINFA